VAEKKEAGQRAAARTTREGRAPQKSSLKSREEEKNHKDERPVTRGDGGTRPTPAAAQRGTTEKNGSWRGGRAARRGDGRMRSGGARRDLGASCTEV